jgi:hypothetical protein
MLGIISFGLLFYQFHVLTAADKCTATDLGYHYLVATNVAPVLLALFLDPHADHLLLLPGLGVLQSEL